MEPPSVDQQESRPSPSPLGYADSSVSNHVRLNVYPQVALICGLLPLITGTLVAGLFTLHRHASFQVIGALTLFAGPFIVLVGLFALLMYVGSSYAPKNKWRRSLTPFLILLANFPAAAACLWLVERTHVTIHNHSPQIIDMVVLTDPLGHTHRIGPIPPGTAERSWVRFMGEGSVTYRLVSQGQSPAGGVAIGFRTPGLILIDAGHLTLTVSHDGSISVREH
ncbi:MAG TPA: hypothetical protein VGN72_05430 [Tepidisphaeraceae bacterium]|jgi:hypothetical protein|nr:hypothetical protein [Tepidisphaeraceae bacterium]